LLDWLHISQKFQQIASHKCRVPVFYCTHCCCCWWWWRWRWRWRSCDYAVQMKRSDLVGQSGFPIIAGGYSLGWHLRSLAGGWPVVSDSAGLVDRRGTNIYRGERDRDARAPSDQLPCRLLPCYTAQTPLLRFVMDLSK